MWRRSKPAADRYGVQEIKHEYTMVLITEQRGINLRNQPRLASIKSSDSATRQAIDSLHSLTIPYPC